MMHDRSEVAYTKKHTYVLSCNHTVVFRCPPTRGDTIFCFKCDDYSLFGVGDPYATCEHRTITGRNIYHAVKRHYDQFSDHHDITVFLPGSLPIIYKSWRRGSD